MRVETPWDGWVNAEIYRSYVADYPIYRWLNARLVALAEVATAHRVLDLACGSGATAQAVLAELPRDGELVGVDASPAMVDLARGHVRDPRARFHVAAAAAVADAVGADGDRRFDRVVSNAAFWQFPSAPPVLRALARVTADCARLVFNVPAERVAGEASPVHGVQAALARAIEEATGRPFPTSATGIDPARLAEELAAAGFALVDRHRRVYRGRQAELVALMEIPAMIAPLTPGLDADQRHELVRRAGRRVDRDEEVEVPWIYFVAERRRRE